MIDSKNVHKSETKKIYFSFLNNVNQTIVKFTYLQKEEKYNKISIYYRNQILYA